MTSTQPQGSPHKRRSLRTELLEERPVNLDGFVEEWPEKGLVAMESAFDPEPGVRVEDGRIVGRGTHQELLATNETYAEIVDSQLSAEEAA